MTIPLKKPTARNQGRLLLKAGGRNVPALLPGNATAPVIVQLVRQDTGACWEAVYDAGAIIKNDAETLKAKLAD